MSSDAAASAGNADADTPLGDAGDDQDDPDGALIDAGLDGVLDDASLDDAADGATDVCASLTLGNAGTADAGSIAIALDPPAGQAQHFSNSNRDQFFIVKNVSNQNVALAALITVGYSVGLSYGTVNNTCTPGSTLAPGQCCSWTTRYNTNSLTASDTVSLFFSTGTGPQWPLAVP